MSQNKTEFMKKLKAGDFCPDFEEQPDLYDMSQIDEYIQEKLKDSIPKSEVRDKINFWKDELDISTTPKWGEICQSNIDTLYALLKPPTK